MMVFQNVMAFRNELAAHIFRKLPNMRVFGTQSKPVPYPLIRLCTRHNMMFPKQGHGLMRFDPAVSQIAFRQGPFRNQCPAVYTNIGITFWIPGTDVQVLFLCSVSVYI